MCIWGAESQKMLVKMSACQAQIQTHRGPLARQRREHVTVVT